MKGERGPRLEARQDRAALVAVSSQIRFWRTPGRVSIQGSSLTMKTCDGGALPRSVTGSTPPVMMANTVAPFGADTVWTHPFGPVPHVPGGHRPELVRDGALDDEDQLIADMPVQRELRVGLDACHHRPSLGLRMLPESLHPHPGLALLPREVADGDDLRQRRLVVVMMFLSGSVP